MKIFKKVSLLALSAALLLSGAACGKSGSTSSGGGSSDGNYTDPNTLFSTYDNKDYNEYLMGDKRPSPINGKATASATPLS